MTKGKQTLLNDDRILFHMIRRRGITYVLTKLALMQWAVASERTTRKRKGTKR